MGINLNRPCHQNGSAPSRFTIFLSHNFSISVMAEDITPERNSTRKTSVKPGTSKVVGSNALPPVLEGVSSRGITDDGINQPNLSVRDGYNSFVLNTHRLLDNKSHGI